MTVRISLAALFLLIATAACAQSVFSAPDLNDPVAGRRDGEAAATRAISSGDLKILTHAGGPAPVGAPQPVEPQTDKLTGLPVKPYGGGCMIDPYFEGYVSGFNERMRAHVARKTQS